MRGLDWLMRWLRCLFFPWGARLLFSVGYIYTPQQLLGEIVNSPGNKHTAVFRAFAWPLSVCMCVCVCMCAPERGKISRENKHQLSTLT